MVLASFIPSVSIEYLAEERHLGYGRRAFGSVETFMVVTAGRDIVLLAYTMESRAAALYPTVYKTVPHSKEFFKPQCQWCHS